MSTLLINRELSNPESNKHQIQVLGMDNQTKYKRHEVNCIAPQDILTVEDVERDILSDLRYIDKLIAIKRFSSKGGVMVGELKGFFNDTIILGRRNEDKERYPNVEIKIDEIEEVYLVVKVQMLSSYHSSEDGLWGKTNSIDLLIENLSHANEKENKDLISILRKNKRKPIKEIRELIWNVSYVTTEEYEFSIKDGLFDIYYTDPRLGWE